MATGWIAGASLAGRRQVGLGCRPDIAWRGRRLSPVGEIPPTKVRRQPPGVVRDVGAQTPHFADGAVVPRIRSGRASRWVSSDLTQPGCTSRDGSLNLSTIDSGGGSTIKGREWSCRSQR